MKTLILVSTLLFFLTSCKKDTNPVTINPSNPYAQKEIEWPSLKKSPWPMYRHDPQLTGRSPNRGPSIGLISDTIILQHFLPASIPVDINNNIYIPFSSSVSDLYSYSLNNKTLNWKLKLPTITYKIPTTPTLLINNSLLYSSTRVYSITNSGNILWQFFPQKTIAGGLNVQVDKIGNVYYIEQEGPTDAATLYCVSSTGQLQWSYTDKRFLYGYCAPAFSPDGNTLYLQGGFNNCSVVAFDILTKNIKWTFGDLPLTSTPIVDNKGNIYFQKNTVGTTVDTFYCLSDKGDLRWNYIFSKRDSKPYQYYYEPTIDHDGNIYILSTPDTLVSLSNEGHLRWKLPINQFGGSNSSLICDGNNNIYFITQNHILLSVGKNGKLIWSIQFNHGFDIYPSLSLLEGKLLLVASYNGLVYIIE